MKRLLCLIAACAAIFSASAERCINLNSGWTFSCRDSATGVDIENAAVNLPHDWSAPLQVNRAASCGNDGGYYPTGTGHYTKHFSVDPSLAGRRNSLCFDGVYMNAEVSLNGQRLGSHAYGWTPFHFDVTDLLDYSGDNILEVSVDNSQQKNCRWYTGSGIYRDVRLVSEPASGAIGQYAVRTERRENGDYRLYVDCATPVDVTISDPSGTVIVTGQQTAKVNTPAEWSPSAPALYTLTLTTPTDTTSCRIGFRTIEYSADKGLILNGKPIQLSGACVHSDNGPLGAAAYRGAEIRRVALLKDAGFNAVRTSHNPPSVAFLDACDSIGLLVIDEIYDGWREAKTPHDYSTIFDRDWMSDVDSWVMRDINHPSIWCWSVGNEVIERTKPQCITTARRLIGRVHSLDPYRPVTSAMCSWGQGWSVFDPLMKEHDICGYNYYLDEAPADHLRVPSRIIMQTESYPADAVKNRRLVDSLDCVIGDFVWTGIDYLGESGIGRYFYKGQTEGEHYERDQWPWHGAYCGDIDIIGWRKPVSHLRDMLWNPDREGVYLCVEEPDGYNGEICRTMWSVQPTWERWTWTGHEGREITVKAFTRQPSVTLYLNGKVVGKADVVDCTATFRIPYRPGRLRAVAADGSSAELATAGRPVRIELTTDTYDDITYITATIVDRNGNPVPEARMTDGKPTAMPLVVEFAIDGTSLLATASADLTDLVPYASPSRAVWNSRAQAIVRTVPGAKVTVTAPGLRPASVTL